MANELKTYLEVPLSPYRYLQVKVDAGKVLRAVLGHLLAASIPNNDATWIEKPLDYSPFYESLRLYVLEQRPLNGSAQCFYWLYRDRTTRIIQYFANAPDFVSVSTAAVHGTAIKCYPLGFWIVDIHSSTALPTNIRVLPEAGPHVVTLDRQERFGPLFPESPTPNGIVLLSGNSMVSAKPNSSNGGPT